MGLGIADISKNTPGLGYFIQARVDGQAEQAAYQAIQSGESDQFTRILPQVTLFNALAEKINLNRAEWTRSIASSYSSGADPKTGLLIPTENNLAKSSR
ncbi:MAG: hypothetical protein VKK32_04430 [Candidatus Melainabacteria bacterium]|nr:hypothetical protein [Candidatus Melainabacteria bacterium]